MVRMGGIYRCLVSELKFHRFCQIFLKCHTVMLKLILIIDGAPIGNDSKSANSSWVFIPAACKRIPHIKIVLHTILTEFYLCML